MGYETALGVMLVGSLLTFVILSVNTDGNKHPAPKLFYILMSLWILVANMAVGLAMAEADSAPAAITTPVSSLYKATITIASFMTIYYIFYFIKALLSFITEKSEMKRNQREDKFSYEA